MTLRLLDLFSGIGGFSLALDSIATTVGYCEIDQNCRIVLQNNMEKGLLHKAHIYEDVKKISIDDLKKIKPNIISAGFPCQDISIANPDGEGINGKRSGLFKEILRIIDIYNHIDVLFLENSPRIIDKGFKYIKYSLIKRGYTVKFCIIKATQVGALHKRERWYCVCFKENIMKLPVILPQRLYFNWKSIYDMEKVINVTAKNIRKNLKIRCKMLGNSIVPQCAMYAWNYLIQHENNLNKILIPFKITKPKTYTLSDGKIIVKKIYWATPTVSALHAYRSLTPRGIGVLANQLYYDINTKIENKGQHTKEYFINPNFIEMLMGYKNNWTEII
jgi:DNA (cytosine-5)-methyltransferase 1